MYIDHALFLKTESASRLRSFRNIHFGESCFIIGNGPSLTTTDLEMISGYISFASNRIYNIFDKTEWRPTYWICIDKNILKHDKDIVSGFRGFVCFVSFAARKFGLMASANLLFVFNRHKFQIERTGRNINIGFSEQADIYIEACETVTYNALQLAVYMGFKKIYLIGVDNNYSKKIDELGQIHIDPTINDYFENSEASNVVSILNTNVVAKAYETARKYCENHGIEIYNATRGGKLEIFVRKSLESVLNND